MGKKLYVGNLGYGVTDNDLSAMFAAHDACTPSHGQSGLQGERK